MLLVGTGRCFDESCPEAVFILAAFSVAVLVRSSNKARVPCGAAPCRLRWSDAELSFDVCLGWVATGVETDSSFPVVSSPLA